jgi:DNA mismatch endonuclease (patch repair protein)
MSRIRGKDTTPEKVVRSLLHKMGYRFRLHVKIPMRQPPAPCCAQAKRRRASPQPTKQRNRFATPDLVLPKYKTAIFVHGCFWHRHRRCKDCTTPNHRREWWLRKLEGNAS